MRRSSFPSILAACSVLLVSGVWAQSFDDDSPGIGPLDLSFHRQAVRRFIFAQEIPLGGILPGQIFGFDQAHPVFETPGKARARFIEGAGVLEIQAAAGGETGDGAVWVSGINPYATYAVDVRSLPPGAQLRMEFGTLPDSSSGDDVPLPDKVEVVVEPDAPSFLTVQVVRAGGVIRTHDFPDGKRVEAPLRTFCPALRREPGSLCKEGFRPRLSRLARARRAVLGRYRFPPARGHCPRGIRPRRHGPAR